MANRNWSSGGKIYSMHTSPVLIDCNFVVDNTSTNGISSLKGPTVTSVYMNTSASASATNPAAGTIVIRLADNYNKSLVGMLHSIQSPNSGTPLTSTTIGIANTITALGTATAAQWQARGLPIGVTPAIGVSFVASSSGVIGGSAAVQITAAAGSGVATIEVVGDPNQSIAPDQSTGQGYGAYLILQCRDYAGALVAPANGSVIGLQFYLSNSSVMVQGE